MLEFGKKIEGVDYFERPGAYVVIRNEKGEFAFAQVNEKYFLPGGGIHAEESPEQTAIREALEEVGAEIVLLKKIGQFGSYANLMKDGKPDYVHKAGTYFAARAVAFHGSGIELDHKLAWLALDQVLTAPMPEAHRWAVQESLKSA